jgi:hypothetical protein
MYYAEDDFGHVWAGPYRTSVPWDSFERCWNVLFSPARVVGFRVVCIDWDIMDYTINLTI